jgi:hypothetical protein
LQQWLAALVRVSDLQAVPWTLLCRPPVSPAQTPAVRQGGEEEDHTGPLPCPPLNQTISAPPIAPAARHSTPQPAAPANAAPSSLPCRHRPRSGPRSPRLVLPLPTIKGPPFFPEKTHLTSLYLLDIISSLVARRFELAGVGRAPGRQPFPVFQPLPQAAAWTRWRRRSSSAA